MRSPKALLSVLLSVLCLFAAASVSAQSSSATLSGSVVDENGAVVPGTQVVVLNLATSLRREAATNDSGYFTVPLLPPGAYTLTATRDGFKIVAVENIVLNVGDVRSLQLHLQTGDVKETVIVTGETALIDDSPAVGTVVNRRFVENLPLNGRSFQALIALTPGVVFTPVGDSGAPGQFSVNGQRTNSNYFMVDGVSANFGVGAFTSAGQTLAGSTPGLTIGGGTNGLVSIDAMQEFRVQTSSYAPEYGRSPGGQISIVTRSGSNEYHGNAFDYLRNDKFDARNYFNKVSAPKPALRQNDFGGTFSGPLPFFNFGEGGPFFTSGKNKTFFFFSYEGLRLLQPTTATGTFYTAAARVNVHPLWKSFVNTGPIPDGPVNPDGRTASLTASYSQPSSFDATSIKIDHNLTKKISIFGRYNHAPSKLDNRFFARVTQTESNTDTLTIGSTFIISSDKINDLRVNWSRQSSGSRTFFDDFMGAVPVPDSVAYPPGLNQENARFNYAEFETFGGFGLGNLAANVQRQLNVVDTFSWTAGTHQLKFGFDWRHLKPTGQGQLNFVAISAPTYADLLVGTIARVSRSTGGGNTLIFNNYSMFAQDTWKTTRKLTLTYGLRWEINPPPVSVTETPLYPFQGIFDSNPLGLAPGNTPMWKTQFGAFAPRFGIAYQVTPKTVVRGGFGLFYDLGSPQGLGSQISLQFPFVNSKVSLNVPFDYSNAAFTPLPFTLTPTTASPQIVTAIDPNLKLPLTYQWNLAVEKQFGANHSLSVSYVGAKGKNLLRRSLITPAAPTVWSQIETVYNGDYSRYDSLQVEFQRRLSRGLQALIGYTLAKSTDSASIDGPFFRSNERTFMQLNPAFDDGYSDFDVRHNFTAGFTYELPFPKWGRVSNEILQGWSLQGIVRARSGLGVTPYSQFTVAATGLSQRLRLNRVEGVPLWIEDGTVGGGRRINPAAFSVPADGQPGNLARNTVRNFPVNQADLALQRNFKLTERVRLDLRAEYFNVFNHPIFSFSTLELLYSTSLTAPVRPQFGKATQTLNNQYGAGGISGGFSPQYQMGGPRSGQLTLKVSF